MYKGKFSQPRGSEAPEVQTEEPVITEESIIAELSAESETASAVAEKPKKKEKKKKKRVGTIVFYSIYLTMTLLLIGAVLTLMKPLEQWLIRFEAARPERRSQEVFAELFEEPDWAELYTLAGKEDTKFENKDAYATYMTEKAAGKELTFLETSAGLSGDRKYIVRLEDEKIAIFTLTGGSENQTEISNWVLGEVELFFERSEGITVEKNPDHTVYINGVALDDSYTIHKVETVAEQYLPEGVHGYRLHTQTVSGLLVEPTVTCKDADGADVPMTLGEDGVYRPAPVQPEEIDQRQTELAIKAAKTYAAYSIQAAGSYELQQYFDSSSQFYRDIVSTVLYTRDYDGFFYDEDNIVVADYCRYSDTVYSVRVELDLKVNLTTGTIKTFESNRTYFFTDKGNGRYLVTNATNVDVTEVKEQVKLEFVNEDETILSLFVDTTTRSLELPLVDAPEGKVLTGWAVKSVDAEGNQTMTIVFVPTDTGFGAFTGDTLVSMTLYPMFDKAEA